MKKYGNLTREDVLEDLEVLAGNPEFLSFRDDYMRCAVAALDFDLASAMLRLGASPDRGEEWATVICATYSRYSYRYARQRVRQCSQ